MPGIRGRPSQFCSIECRFNDGLTVGLGWALKCQIRNLIVRQVLHTCGTLQIGGRTLLLKDVPGNPANPAHLDESATMWLTRHMEYSLRSECMSLLRNPDLHVTTAVSLTSVLLFGFPRSKAWLLHCMRCGSAFTSAKLIKVGHRENGLCPQFALLKDLYHVYTCS